MGISLDNSAVYDYVNRLERQGWGLIEKCAIENPNAVRFLSIVVAIERIANAIFFGPAVFIEKVILTGKGVKDYLATSDQQQKNAHLETCKKYAVESLKAGFVYIPTSFIMHIIQAIGEFFLILTAPLYTAKYSIASLDRKSYVQNRPDHEIFVDGAFDRYISSLQYCNNITPIADFHFMDTGVSKDRLIAEFNAKKAVLDREFEVFNQIEKNEMSIGLWEKFKQDLVNAVLEDVEGMRLIPTAPTA